MMVNLSKIMRIQRSVKEEIFWAGMKNSSQDQGVWVLVLDHHTSDSAFWTSQDDLVSQNQCKFQHVSQWSCFLWKFSCIDFTLKIHSSSALIKDYNLRNPDFSTLWIIVCMKRRTDLPQACPHWGKAKIRTLIFKSCDKILCQEEH